jgi:phosphoserine aminotransferase
MTCSYAAENGNLEVLKWARENGCEWESNTCSCAAWNGHLEVLKWAKNNGCVCGGIYHKN